MKNKFITIMLCMVLTSAVLAGCGKDKTDDVSSIETIQEESGEAEQEMSTSELFTEGEHDASEKDNSVKADIKTALNAGKGSLTALSGIYSVELNGELINGESYILDNGDLYIIKEGSYDMGSGKITLENCDNPKTEYDITETDNGFNLMAGGTLIPLVYAEGTDGLTGDSAFDGIYTMGSTGYEFSEDGSFVVIEKSSYELDGNTITFGGNTEQFEAKDGKMILSNNGTVVMTLVPKG